MTQKVYNTKIIFMEVEVNATKYEYESAQRTCAYDKDEINRLKKKWKKAKKTLEKFKYKYPEYRL